MLTNTIRHIKGCKKMRGKRVRGQLQRGAGGLHCMFGLQLYRLSPIVCRAPDWYLPPPTGNDMKSSTRWLIARMAARLTKSECKSNSCWHLNASMSSWIQHKLLKVAKAFKKGKAGEKWERPPRMKLPAAGSLAYAAWSTTCVTSNVGLYLHTSVSSAMYLHTVSV